MRFAESTTRHNALRQCVWDLSGRLMPTKGAVLRWTPNRAPYSLKVSTDENFAPESTREWKKLNEAHMELGEFKPGTTYYWRTDDNMHRNEAGHFMTEGGKPDQRRTDGDGGKGGSAAPAGFIQST